MSQPNKDNRPEAVLDRVLEKTGVMSQPKSNEEIINELANEIHSTFASAYAIKESVSHEWLKNIISKALAQKDAEVAEAVKAERSRIEIELMSAEKHSHPGEPGLFLQWSDLKKALTPKE